MLACALLPVAWVHAQPNTGPDATPADKQPAAYPSPPPGDVAIRSERLVVDTTRQTARFEGDVVVQQGNLTLKCEQLDADYDPEGHPTRLIATGRVRLSRGELFATAGRAVYQRTAPGPQPKGTVTLTQNPQVWQGSNWMSGRSVTIALAEGRVDVEAPRGMLKVPPPPEQP